MISSLVLATDVIDLQSSVLLVIQTVTGHCQFLPRACQVQS
jgi:hypothetical protein